MTRLTTELRAGNLVTVNNPTAWPELLFKPLKVIGFELKEDEMFPESTGHVRLEDEDRETYSQLDEFISPIELSEEWLIKLGFVLKRLDTEDTFERYYLPIPNSNLYIANTITYQWVQLWDENHKSVGFGGCQYVHQLQNLYFSLTSLELNIKE
jgi:hypothetical protein